jgi:hypothetical protein
MAHSPATTIAYYTLVDDPRTGWTGGLLLLNRSGRPLEFQCTMPVRPTRAHEILYGPTLRPYLIAEVIGPLLIEKCRTPISLLCCDQPEALALASNARFPVALVREAWERCDAGHTDEPHGEGPGDLAGQSPKSNAGQSNAGQSDVGQSATGQSTLGQATDWTTATLAATTTVLLSGSRLLVKESQAERVRAITRGLVDLPDTVEPFERIREALNEAHAQITRAATSRVEHAA